MMPQAAPVAHSVYGDGSVYFDDAHTKHQARATAAAKARRESGVRRNIDPTTCERAYSDAETEFMKAMEEYKRTSGRKFPTWSEVLEVLGNLGYCRPAEEVSL